MPRKSPTVDPRAQADEAAQFILQAAARNNGVTRTEVNHAFSAKRRAITLSVLTRMVADGVVHVREDRQERRYFASAAACAAWRPPTKVDLTRRIKGEPAPRGPRLYEPEHVRLEGTISAKLRQTTVTPIVLPGTKPSRRLTLCPQTPVIGPLPAVQVLPSAPVYARHQIAPWTRVWGCGFAALGPWRYLPDPPSPHVVAITRDET